MWQWSRVSLRAWLVAVLIAALVLGPVFPASGMARMAVSGTEDLPGSVDYVPGEVIVRFKDEALRGKSLAAAAGELAAGKAALGLQRARTLPRGAALFRTAVGVPQTVAALRNDPRVAYAQPNYIYRPAAAPAPNDPLWDRQWGLQSPDWGVRTVTAWTYTQGDPEVIVAVLDSGVDYLHPDLTGRVITLPGSNFAPLPGYNDNPDDPMDDHGHGTHVAGIIAAAADNGAGIAGVAPEVRILAVKVLNGVGWGSTVNIAAGINYAGAHGAQVVNMSLGGPGFDTYMYEAIRDNPGMLFVAAAGNSALNTDIAAHRFFPAGYTVHNTYLGQPYPALSNIVAVAALAPNGSRAWFSNYGQQSVGLAAPGAGIMSTVPAAPTGAGLALAVEHNDYKVMFWGFGAEDMVDPSLGTSVTGAVYRSVVRTVYDFLGVTPTDTVGRPLLLVDDDLSHSHGSRPDVSPLYQNALETAGYNYVRNEVDAGQSGPAPSTLVYSGVIWFTGRSIGNNPDKPSGTPWVPNLTTGDRNNLIAYLNDGGRLFLSGSDIGYLIEDTPFYREYLDAVLVAEWEGLFRVETITGREGGPYNGDEYALVVPHAWIDVLRPRTNRARVVLDYAPYAAWDGTSMAAPFVAGVAALVLSLDRELAPETVIGLLKEEVTPAPALAGLVATGGTLNAAGALAGYTALDQVAAVTASPAAGVLAAGSQVSLSTATPGAAIRYTLDGSEPNGASALYTGQISITTTTTIKARAYKSGMRPGPTAAFAYTVLSNNAALSTLTLSSGSLNPVFASGTFDYTASVANSVSSIIVTPTAHAGAVIRVNGAVVTSGHASGPIILEVGGNTISVLVTAEDGITNRTYSITITRESAGGGIFIGGGGGGGAPPPIAATVPAPVPDTDGDKVVINEAFIDALVTAAAGGKKVETFTVRAEAADRIKAGKAAGKNAVEIVVGGTGADVTVLKMPWDVLQNAGGLNIVIALSAAVLMLPETLVGQLAAGAADLSVTISRGDAGTLKAGMAGVPAAADAEILGTPIVINTALRGATTVTLPLDGVSMPHSVRERELFLDRLRVFALHSDGTAQVYPGKMVYDVDGQPVAINFEVEKFSTFAVIRTARPDTAPVAGKERAIQLRIGERQALVDGQPYVLEAAPYLKTGVNRTLVPVRFVSEALGASVDWLAQNRQVIIWADGAEMVLTIGSDRALVNEQPVLLDCPPEVVAGRTFVPLRFVSEALGAQVKYDALTRTIAITGTVRPDEGGPGGMQVTVAGMLDWSMVEMPHWELRTDKETYVLLPGTDDRHLTALLQLNRGRRVTVNGYLSIGPDIYMRGPVLRVYSLIP